MIPTVAHDKALYKSTFILPYFLIQQFSHAGRFFAAFFTYDVTYFVLALQVTGRNPKELQQTSTQQLTFHIFVIKHTPEQH